MSKKHQRWPPFVTDFSACLSRISMRMFDLVRNKRVKRDAKAWRDKSEEVPQAAVIYDVCGPQILPHWAYPLWSGTACSETVECLFAPFAIRTCLMTLQMQLHVRCSPEILEALLAKLYRPRASCHQLWPDQTKPKQHSFVAERKKFSLCILRSQAFLLCQGHHLLSPRNSFLAALHPFQKQCQTRHLAPKKKHYTCHVEEYANALLCCTLPTKQCSLSQSTRWKSNRLIVLNNNQIVSRLFRVIEH